VKKKMILEVRNQGCWIEKKRSGDLDICFSFHFFSNFHEKYFLKWSSVDMKLGRNLARTFLDYYKLIGFITSKPSSSIVPKPGGPYRSRDRNTERTNTDPPMDS